MTKKEIEQKERENAKFFRDMGYTFKSLVAHTLQRARYTSELEQRLRLIDSMRGAVCLCSAMVGDQKVEGNTVPLLYCVIKEGKDAAKCPYARPKKEELERALELHKRLLEAKT